MRTPFEVRLVWQLATVAGEGSESTTSVRVAMLENTSFEPLCRASV